MHLNKKTIEIFFFNVLQWWLFDGWKMAIIWYNIIIFFIDKKVIFDSIIIVEEHKIATSINVIVYDYRNANGFIFSSISLNERYENKKIVREI